MLFLESQWWIILIMGNTMSLSDESGSSSAVTKEEYLGLRTKGWSFNEGYLYQTEFERTNEEKIKVVSYELDLEDRKVDGYFQKLNMMSNYLNKGNVELPLLCITEGKEECNCRLEAKTIVKVYYQIYEIPLIDEVKARQRCRQQFKEEEIWYIMYCLTNALRQYEPFSEPSGNFSIQQVLMNSKGEIKLKVSLSSPFEPLRNSIFLNYFSPEELSLMKSLSKNETCLSRSTYKQHHINPNISQMYSLGILLLVLATGCNVLNLYSPPYKVNEANIANELSRIPTLGYSKLFFNLVKVLLSEYGNRPLPSQVRQIFKEFQFQILNFKPFDFSFPPSQSSSVH